MNGTQPCEPGVLRRHRLRSGYAATNAAKRLQWVAARPMVMVIVFQSLLQSLSQREGVVGRLEFQIFGPIGSIRCSPLLFGDFAASDTGRERKPSKSGAKRTGQAKGRRFPSGKRPWQLASPGGGFSVPVIRPAWCVPQNEKGKR